MIGNILHNFLGHKKIKTSLDDQTKNMLLAAAGSYGGEICDYLLQYTSTKEEKFMVSIKTGAFGIAIVAYFYTTEYCHNLAPLVLANELFDTYKNFYTDVNQVNKQARDALNNFMDQDGKTLLPTTIGAILCNEADPDKTHWTLSRVLYQSIREGCMINEISNFKLEKEQINGIQEKIRTSYDPLRASIGYFIEQSKS
ncbi:MAG TPA: hypothetical protein PLK94_03045 [Alphaproteobacteria bacterium]|nr:hypothetical protein [Alphaproteobacteria bacterium]HOO50246.1 hypothetical protein [Alphaproteobacteria bacterium]